MSELSLDVTVHGREKRDLLGPVAGQDPWPDAHGPWPAPAS